MRFPEHISMRRVFHLFKYPPLNTNGIALEKRKRPYYFTAVDNNAFQDFNGAIYRQNAVPASSSDPYKARSVIFDIPDPSPYYTAGPDAILDDVVKPFAEGLYADLQNNTKTGWAHLMRYDHYSARAYMTITYRPSSEMFLPPTSLSTDIVNWVETIEDSTGSYDRALSETVLDAIAFGWTPSEAKVNWWCIELVIFFRSRPLETHSHILILNARIIAEGPRRLLPTCTSTSHPVTSTGLCSMNASPPSAKSPNPTPRSPSPKWTTWT